MSLFKQAERLYCRAISLQTDESDLDEVIAWAEKDLSVLFACTDQVRRHFFEDTVDPCAIMNVKSGGCSEDCAFCSQSAHNNAQVTVTAAAGEEEILTAYRAARGKGLAFGVVSSGRKLSPAELTQLVNSLEKCEGPIHASLGLLSQDELHRLHQAGVVCYNHNLETGKEFFEKIVSTHRFEDRVETVRRAKKAGMSVCCGGIFGLGEGWEDRKSMCMTLRELRVDTIPINFLNPIPGTRSTGAQISPLTFLKMISLVRIALPDRKIKVCGGREVNLGPLQSHLFFAGANGYISGDYLTTKGDLVEADDAMIEALGLRKAF